jgi:hypothetical protein
LPGRRLIPAIIRNDRWYKLFCSSAAARAVARSVGDRVKVNRRWSSPDYIDELLDDDEVPPEVDVVS